MELFRPRRSGGGIEKAMREATQKTTIVQVLKLLQEMAFGNGFNKTVTKNHM